MIPKQHYCSGCKRMIPLAPGITHKFASLGVAHVVQEPMMHAVPCRPQRTYSSDDQISNLREMTLWG